MKKLIVSVIALVALLANVPTSSNASSRYCKRTITTHVYRICEDEKGNVISKELDRVIVETKYVFCDSPK